MSDDTKLLILRVGRHYFSNLIGDIPSLILQDILRKSARLELKVKPVGLGVDMDFFLLLIQEVSVVVDAIKDRRNLYIATHISRNREKHHALFKLSFEIFLWRVLLMILTPHRGVYRVSLLFSHYLRHHAFIEESGL